MIDNGKEINVLSLFYGLNINKYYDSEIDKYSKQITHNTIQLGDVTNWLN